ncbi:MAG: futalosine hydrolase [Vulcanimicrobiaceae bacterium]
MTKVLIVCALESELRYFRRRAGTELLFCGVGPVEAAVATVRALAAQRYDAVVNAGIAGAFPGRARVGDALLVATEWLAELGLEGGGEFTLPDGASLVERADADPALVERCAGLPYRVGSGITVASVTATRATGERLALRYGADVESMEGFSVLRAAGQSGVPAFEVRGVSNYVGDRAESAWDFSAGARAAAVALEAVLARIIA